MENNYYKDPVQLSQDKFPIWNPDPELRYSSDIFEQINALSMEAVIYWDIEGTAVIDKSGNLLVRRDFIELYNKVRSERPDIQISALTYRSKESGIPIFPEGTFDSVFFSEDIRAGCAPTGDVQDWFVELLLLLKGDPEPYVYEELNTLYKLSFSKIKYLSQKHPNTLNKTYLIDDGFDGKIAEMLHIGYQAKV